jgi:starch synthase (maltosyl-transferring)
LRKRSLPEEGRCRVLIEGVTPEIDCGRYRAKRTVGERLEVAADLVADGHDELAGVLLCKGPGESRFAEAPLRFTVNDRWVADVELDRIGVWRFTLEAWVDRFATWRKQLEKRLEGGPDIEGFEVELLIGANLVEAVAARARGKEAARLIECARAIRADSDSAVDRARGALDPELLATCAGHPDRARATRYGRELEVTVDPVRARFSSWYEMFPRSCGAPGVHGTFRDAEARLRYVAEMGFDVLYLPPIHPIGESYRKGKNNTLTCEPGDPGSPWAIGSALGGHTAVHPELGTLEDFRRFRVRAEELGLSVALDIAFQASPDHPWVTEHPEWFTARPDGTIQYAENPPKKYQDIYPLNFDSEDWQGLWQELRDVFLYWVEQGVKIFRVDNPHTKSLRFWDWCIDDLKRGHPDLIFLAEAFTKPKLMYNLAKAGFTQSYTYFTWRDSKQEFVEYLTELTRTQVAEYFRYNFWPNTPDILPEQLQHGGRPAFTMRLVLAATLAASWGIYGPAFELMDHVARPGSGEYIDNEKYEFKTWEIDRPDSLAPLIALVNRIRREHPALQQDRTLAFHATDNDALLCYSKRTEDRKDVILCVVNLDPHHTHSGWVELDLEELGVPSDQPFEVLDLLSGASYPWQGGRNFVMLNPWVLPAHVFEIRREVPPA